MMNRSWWSRLAGLLHSFTFTIIGSKNLGPGRELPFNERARDIMADKAVLRYVAAVGISVVILMLKYLLNPYIGQATPFLLFPMAILLASWWGGLGPGLLATLVTGAAAARFQYMGGGWSLWRVDLVIQLVTHMLSGVVISALVAARNEIQVQGEYQRKWLGVMLSSIGDGVMAIDIKGKVMFVNNAAGVLIGMGRERIMGARVGQIYKLVDEESGRQVDDLWRRVLQTGGAAETDNRVMLVPQKGKRVPVELSAAPIMDENGNLKGVVKVFRDVTEKREAERIRRALIEQLDWHMQRLDTIVANVPGVVWEIWDRPDPALRRVNFVSLYLETLTGYTAKDLGGEKEFWRKLVHPEDLEILHNESRKIYEFTGGGIVEVRLVRKDGGVIWVQNQMVAIKDETGQPVGMRGVTMDITVKKEAEMRKDEFVSMASHELKTPVTTIRVIGQVVEKLMRKKGEKELAKHLKKMNMQVDRLSALVRDILDISRMQAGAIPFRMRNIDLDRLVSEVSQGLQETTNSRYQITVDGGLGRKIWADRERVAQVLTNLLNNAIKYSGSNRQVVVGLKKDGDKAVVTVRDFGIGIARENQARLFEKFFRGGGGVEKTCPGMGMGLYISSQIVKKHGGKIWVESEKGQGSTFYFTLPYDARKAVRQFEG